MALDAFSEEFVSDPYPHYERIRSGPAAQREVQPNGMVSWVVPSYEHARQVLIDPRFSNSFEYADKENLLRGGVLDRAGSTTLGPAMILSDPPEHTRLRGLVSRAFTPRRVQELRPHVQTLVDQLVDALPTHGVVDLIAEFAEPLPVTVICQLLGVPTSSRGDFKAWIRDMITTPTTAEDKDRRASGADALAQYMGDMVARRQPLVDLNISEEEQPDLLSALIRARDGEGRLSGGELIGTMLQLLMAGYETARNLIGNGVLALLRHPDQLALLRAHPDLLTSAIEELLRFDGPVARPSYRVAKQDVEIGGVTIPAGSLVSVLIGSANRDPHRFPDPNRLDICRDGNQHLAFAYGVHYCVGAPLARMEAELAIGTLLTRFPDLGLASGAEIRWQMTSIFIRGLTRLPVKLGRALNGIRP